MKYNLTTKTFYDLDPNFGILIDFPEIPQLAITELKYRHFESEIYYIQFLWFFTEDKVEKPFIQVYQIEHELNDDYTKTMKDFFDLVIPLTFDSLKEKHKNIPDYNKLQIESEVKTFLKI